MKKIFRPVLVTLATLGSVVVLAIGATMSSAVSLAAKAFIVPGTGTPNANVVGGYMEQALDRYIAPFDSSCTSQADCELQGIDYFASFWPFAFISGWCVPGRCEKWDVSVEDGRANLHTALEPYLGTDEEIVIFGYSQGAAVTSNEMRYLGENYAPEQFDNFSVVNIGSIDNRVGGAWTVLGFLDYIPILDVTTNLYNPIATGMPMTTINFQYDPVGSLPLYFNLLAIVNALVALDNVHGQYLAPNEGNDGTLPYGYTDETLAAQLNCAATNNCKRDEFGNLYVTIPARGLPLLNFVRDVVDGAGIGWLVDPFIDLVEPVMQVLIDTAYAPEADPGDVRYLSLLPFNPQTNLLEFGNDIFRASIAGVEAFVDAIFDSPSAAEPESRQSAAAVSVDADSGVEAPEAEAVAVGPEVDGSTTELEAMEATSELTEAASVVQDTETVEEAFTEPAVSDASVGEDASVEADSASNAKAADEIEDVTGEESKVLEDSVADHSVVEINDADPSDADSDSADGDEQPASADSDVDAGTTDSVASEQAA